MPVKQDQGTISRKLLCTSNNCLSIYRFGGNDGKSDAAPHQVKAILCDCSGNGVCDYAHHRLGYHSGLPFQIIACNCNEGWLGEK